MTLTGAGAESILSEGELVFLASDHPEDENSFDEPKKVCAEGHWCSGSVSELDKAVAGAVLLSLGLYEAGNVIEQPAVEDCGVVPSCLAR